MDENENKQEYDLNEVVKAVGVEAILKIPEVDKEVVSRRDRHTTQALQTAKTKWDADAKAKADKDADEATRLAAMTEAEKERYQLKKEREAFEAQKAEYSHKALVVETAKQMVGSGLPDLSEYITGRDADETAARLESVKGVLGQWKATILDEAMRGKTPSDMKPAEAVTRESLKHMSAAEINKLFEAGALKNLK